MHNLTSPFITSKEISETLLEVFDCCPTILCHQLMHQVEIKEVKQNTVFIQQGDPSTGIYIVLKGTVKAYHHKKGKTQVIHYYNIKDIVGVCTTMEHSGFEYTAQAMEDIILGFISTEHIFKLISKYPQLYFSLLKKINAKAVSIETRGASLMTDNAESILVKAIEDLQNRFGTDAYGYVQIHIPAKELAGYVGMSKTNFYRTLEILKEKSILFHHLNKYRLEKSLAS